MSAGRQRAVTATLAVAHALALGCHGGTADTAAGRKPGLPLVDLSASELARFSQGQALFNRVFQPAEGLGPAFNENQCSGCHTDPASGGSGEQRVVKATRFENGACDPLEEEGGLNVRSQATPLLRAHGVERETVPASATARGRFTAPFLFGLGLVEAIPDRVIREREDPDDRDGDGISGRAGRTADDRLARFGRKAEFATVLEFVASALRLEMGLTSPLAPVEPPVNGAPVPPGVDPVPEPEVDRETVERLADYVRFLAPPARAPLTDTTSFSVRQGERVFERLGCPSCHVPVMETGRTDVSALDRKAVRLYSDLLLHDMGARLADVCAPFTLPAEVRTEMLMGLQYRDAFLHDGRAPSVRDAIVRHGGEALPAVEAFVRLEPMQQIYLLRFLDTL